MLGLEGRKVLLYVGRLTRRKGVKEFIEKSLPRIVVEVPEACFVVVGENPTESLIHHGDMMGDLQAFVREVGLQNHVRLLGWLSDEDLAKIYQACDLVVLPVLPLRDDVEGFGIVLLEAAAAGKPCVATRVGGIPDALEDGKSGILLDPGNYKLMSQTIVRLLGDDRSRIDLGEYARKRVREEFAWDQIVMKYEEMFGSTMKKTLV
jgi:phosphatidylinositol alpha-1,6-mannosyltransferase